VIAMIFEFWFDLQARETFDEYLAESEELRTYLADFDGFRGVERFESCAEPGKFVAIGFFDDERAVAEWRDHPAHRRAQALGRSRFFVHYRLRMAEVVRDYGPRDREQAPHDSRLVHGPSQPGGSQRDA
jgi:heme-degrading monooxygenase HmoA